MLQNVLTIGKIGGEEIYTIGFYELTELNVVE
jgi:hypothetical protein